MKITIITINYNNLEGLKKTVKSVVNQTWKEFEYIVIDGSSTDGSPDFIDSQSKNIDYWISEPDKGIYNAMNKGIAKASGDYLLFLNSGDHLYDDKVLAKIVSHLTSYDLVCFDMQVLGREKPSIFSAPDAVRFSDLCFDFLPHPTTFVKKELFVTVGLYDESFAIISDWKFFILALFKYNCSYKKINETLSTFYADGISSAGNHSRERRQVLGDNFSGYVLDFDELALHRKWAKTNRFKILSELEKSTLGKKAASLFLRTGLFLFSRKKLNDL